MTTAHQTQAIAKPTPAENFLKRLEREFIAQMGSPIAWTDLQRTLGQHLFIKIGQKLAEYEAKRAANEKKQDQPPIVWANVNMEKLTTDAVTRVFLELDAFLPNHISPIPYLNSATQLYDVDLRIGYAGKDHCARKFAIEPPMDIEYHLVHEGDEFRINHNGGIESYTLVRADYFNPGRVIGGFGYVKHANAAKNRVHIVEFREFEKAIRASKNAEFWGGEMHVLDSKGKWAKDENGAYLYQYDDRFRKEMEYKTVVIRVCNKIPLDTAKINGAAWDAINGAGIMDAAYEIDQEVSENANGQIIELPQQVTESVDQVTGEVKEAEEVEVNPYA